MPAKKRSATPKKKKKPAKKTVARRAPAKRRSTAAKKRDAATGIPDSILRLAEEAHQREEDSKRSSVSLQEPEERLRELAEASAPSALVRERQEHLDEQSSFDTVVVAEQPSERVAAARPLRAPAAPRAARHDGEVVVDVEDLHVFYGAVEALKGMSFQVHAGETVAIIGSNGAGKTTTLKTVSGVSELLKSVRGRVTIMGRRVESWPAHKIARLGVAHSPEGRKIFPNQTVRDNLMLGAFGRGDGEIDADIARMEERFPILGQRRNQPAGLMSGGEQQMLAMARALMARPKVLLFDEPSMGLAPLIVKQIFDIIAELRSEGKTILLVEQMAFQALGIADRGYVLETGAITMEGTGRELLEDPRVKEAYLGA